METAHARAELEGFWLRIIYIVSALVCAAVAFLILGPRPSGSAGSIDVSMLPTVNASLNLLTTILIVAGWLQIKKRRIAAHKRLMLAAFASSTAFLMSYVIYHWFKQGPRPYTGSFRAVYLVVLLTHIVLAVVIVPLGLVTLYRGWSMAVAKHRAIAKLTLPIWLYVSITGVAIYVMLYL